MIAKISFVAILSLLHILPTSLVLYAKATSRGRDTLELSISIGSGSGSGGSSKDCGDELLGNTDQSQCSQEKIPLLGPIIQAPLLSPVVQAPIVQGLLNFIDQRLALVYPVIQLFKSTITSDPLGITNSWVGGDICKYKGFYCDSPPDNKSATALASIDFNGFGLSAPSLDGFLDQLPDIALFHANSNKFAGTISPNIAKLRYLYELDLSNNKLSGPFPTVVLGMTDLIFLDLRFNSFSGAVPAQIFTRDLYVLFLNNNAFDQTLPDNLGNTHVLYLTLANNKFTGPIPRSIAGAPSTLTEVLFLNNRFSGCLPYEIGLLDETVVLDAGNNQLTGPLPLSLFCLEKVEQLNLGGNLFYGMVPEPICWLGLNRNLVNLSLSDNYFQHVGPWCRALIEKGILNVRNNCIPDLPFQRPVADCARFFAQPRPCPRMWSYSYVPCRNAHLESLVPGIAPSP